MSGRQLELRSSKVSFAPHFGSRPIVPNSTPSSIFEDPNNQWKRNPSWPALPAVTSSDQRVVGLYAIFSGGGNFWAATCSGDWQVNFGDGTSVVTSSGVTVYKEFNYTASALVGTEAPVTFTSATHRVNRTSHGYVDRDPVNFYNITGTSGVVYGQTYYVVSASANDFQISTVLGSSSITFAGNGSGSLLPYRVATIDITPSGSSTLTGVNLSVLHNQPNLQNGYANGWLDLTISLPSASARGLLLSSASLGVTTRTIPRYLERCNIVNAGNLTSLAAFFLGALVLRSVSVNAPFVTDLRSMFNNCRSLTAAPLFDTTNVTTMFDMFNSCFNLTHVPLYDTQNVTDMRQMFINCYSLPTVPLFNTAKVTDVTNMFNSCYSLQTVPLFDYSSVTTVVGNFALCRNLKKVPQFNTSKVTSFESMFFDCWSLAEVPLLNMSSSLSAQYVFYRNFSLRTVPLFNTSNVRTMFNMFEGCNSLTSVPQFDMSNVTNANNMFLNCTALETIPQFNTSALTGSIGMFNGCQMLTEIPALNVSSVASATNFTNIFSGCINLTKIEASQFKHSFSVANAKLSGEALNAIYTALPSVTSSQTITVTGNYGTATHTPAIATGKGWTVTV